MLYEYRRKQKYCGEFLIGSGSEISLIGNLKGQRHDAFTTALIRNRNRYSCILLQYNHSKL